MKYTRWEKTSHWLQAVAIIMLLLTGFQMHYPDHFSLFNGLKVSLNLHLIMGVVLLVNGFLYLFYQVTAGHLFQYIPTLNDILDGGVKQARYYLSVIFPQITHTFKRDERYRLTPLQRIVYFSLLAFLLPLQLITGILLFGVIYWPLLFKRFGGLEVIAPLHTLLAFLFLSFLILHMYLSTSGEPPFAYLKSMTFGGSEEH